MPRSTALSPAEPSARQAPPAVVVDRMTTIAHPASLGRFVSSA
jgi:hypothetical protein